MLKKTIMLGMAVAIAAAFAVPAAATASNWKEHTQVLQANRQIQLTGAAGFLSGPVGGITCETTAKITANANSTTGTVDEFIPDLDEVGSTVTTKCKGSGLLVNCQVHKVQPLNLPWTIHNETQRVEVTSGLITIEMTGGFCPAKIATVTPVNALKGHTVTATPNQPHTVTTFTLSGEVEVHLYKEKESEIPVAQATAVVSDTQTIVSAGDKHRYSLT
jgi:hypothetical protein